MQKFGENVTSEATYSYEIVANTHGFDNCKLLLSVVVQEKGSFQENLIKCQGILWKLSCAKIFTGVKLQRICFCHLSFHITSYVWTSGWPRTYQNTWQKNGQICFSFGNFITLAIKQFPATSFKMSYRPKIDFGIKGPICTVDITLEQHGRWKCHLGSKGSTTKVHFLCWASWD